MAELSKSYEPQPVEVKWYQYWLEQKLFVADPARVSEKRPAYSIVIPPPNVTGVLHMGHVLNNTIQDILARKARMDGKEVLWLPGTDHAGIATEGMVAKQLKKEEKKSKQDIGREEFLKRVWAWKEKHGGIIIEQLKKLGCSCDWSRERFTMDPDYVRCVQKVFVELYKKGLIYRGKRMVNWCPASKTALSDEEVEMKPQKGFMYHFKVEVVDAGSARAPRAAVGAPADGSEPATSSTHSDFLTRSAAADEASAAAREARALPAFLTIATTRPETIPGDTAVAVNPKDPRYAHLIGKHVLRPLPPELPREQKLIPIVGDEHVDFEFGTGVLKVTPAHDKADFEIGQRHQLPVVDIMNPDATMNALAGQDLAGLDRFAARKVAAEKLREMGSLLEEKPYENNVGFSQRADVPVEPRLSEQWFLKYPSVEKSKACVAEGRMKFYPDRWAKVYDHWLTNIQDWCISRQLWWGHRVPVWSKTYDGYSLCSVHTDVSDVPTPPPSMDHRFVSVDSPEVAIAIDGKPVTSDSKRLLEQGLQTQESNPEVRLITAQVCTIDHELIKRLEAEGWEKDPDVLDTWFSSWLWPFATMGWTGDKETDAKNATLRAFYPTTDLVTAPEIIFFWVARMIMAGYEFMGDLPFRNVYFNGIVRDKKGDKMSKSKGNSPDPLELIAKYGADAIRFGTMRSAPLGQDVLFDEKDVELGRNFCNKLWNACRFRQMQGGEVQGEINTNKLRSDDKWILLKLHQCIKDLNAAFAEYKFSDATRVLYDFFWGDFCDYYVETTKPVFQGTDALKKANVLAVMDFVLSHTLRLFHPFLPFVTEELWRGMGYADDMPADQGGRSIMQAPWPKPFDGATRDHYSLDDCYLDFVNAKIELIAKGRNLRKESKVADNKKVRFILKPSQGVAPNDLEVIRTLLNAETVEVDPEYQPQKGVASTKAAMGELYLPLEGLIDVAAELARLTKELELIGQEIAKVEQKLANPNFVQKVPPSVLAEHTARRADWLAKKEHAQKAIDGLKG